MHIAMEVVETLWENHKLLLANPTYTEADTITHLIDPVLAYLGYPASHQLRESQINKNRPDIVLWNKPFVHSGSEPANAILEAKPLNHDLEGKGESRAERPKNQIRRYVNGYQHSRPGTYGILTDGNIWYMIQRAETESHAPYIFIDDWKLLEGTKAEAASALEQVDLILKGSQPVAAPLKLLKAYQKAQAICQAIADKKGPAEILHLLTNKTGHRATLEGQVQLLGKAKEAESSQWAQYAYTTAGRIKAEQGDLDHEASSVAVMRATRAESADDETLYREDTAIAAITFAKAVPLKMSVTLVVQPDSEDDPSTARLAVHYQGHTGMTSEFNPNTPAPMTLRTIQRIYDQLNKKAPVMAKTLTDAVAARGVRQDFYKQIANGWTLRQQRKAKGAATQRHAYREAVLRHLIRTIFAWILKEDGKLPPEPFDEAFAKREASGNYHDGILTFLFHERLNRQENERIAHTNSEINKALSDTRFLNGSLFSRHKHDHLLKLDDADYFGTNPNEPGLFTILNEYEWTASEHSPQSSDQTIDPEVLSNLFENLIAATMFGDEVPDRMPAGTYYTPSDVALEMVKDALASAVEGEAPKDWKRRDLVELFGDEETPIPEASAPARTNLVERIRNLTIYDPAVGSGEFPFISTLAIKSALRKLGVPDDNAILTRDIISRQIFAQDISPMAVQVARLRLFIAIIAAESGGGNHPPLPNLEAKIVCADTLATVADKKWTPIQSGTLQSTQEDVNKALLQLAEIRRQWQVAHDEATKESLRRQDDDARNNLRTMLRGKMANQETTSFAQHPLLQPDAPPATTDARLLFYDDGRDGFDIVIGNPPYEDMYKDLQADKNSTKEEKQALSRKKKERRDNLVQNKKYTTTDGKDLYNLMAEAALALVKPTGGVVTLIVPLSICFGQDKKSLRQLFESRCNQIRLRCQDNRPDKAFHDSPVESAESRQRTTIITARTGDENPRIEISGTNRWRKSERHEYLTSRQKSLVRSRGAGVEVNLDAQWERIPTKEVQDLISHMRLTKNKIRDLSQTGENDYRISFPMSAMYFITATPPAELGRDEMTFPIAKEEHFELAIAAANSHVAYVWWATYGDAFHIKANEMKTIAIPAPWLDDEDTNREVRELARSLLQVIYKESEHAAIHRQARTLLKVVDDENKIEEAHALALSLFEAIDEENTTTEVCEIARDLVEKTEGLPELGQARMLANQMIMAIKKIRKGETIKTGTSSKEQDSLDLHVAAPEIIEGIDKLYLKALGLQEEPLLTQLRTIRGDSTWRLGSQW